jgi:hypothetical protein
LRRQLPILFVAPYFNAVSVPSGALRQESQGQPAWPFRT